MFIQNGLAAEDDIRNRVIYFIHGDADYLYHDTDGNSLSSDEMILQQAVQNAEKGRHSEYFIFHFKPKRTFLVFFPGEESDFYHYRNGLLVTEKKYFRYEPVNGHSAEVSLIKESQPVQNVEKNILLYYGHEIPLEEEFGYNASFPEVPVGLKSFSAKLAEILTSTGESKFDLIILSTCNNGSPEFILELSPFAKYIIASPGDLHLSQMNSLSLQFLDANPSIPLNAFALYFADEAFDLLRINTLTEVVISVYNTENLINGNYDALAFCSGEMQDKSCLRVFFRPAKFGKNKDRISHSGWYCRDGDTISSKYNE